MYKRTLHFHWSESTVQNVIRQYLSDFLILIENKIKIDFLLWYYTTFQNLFHGGCDTVLEEIWIWAIVIYKWLDNKWSLTPLSLGLCIGMIFITCIRSLWVWSSSWCFSGHMSSQDYICFPLHSSDINLFFFLMFYYMSVSHNFFPKPLVCLIPHSATSYHKPLLVCHHFGFCESHIYCSPYFFLAWHQWYVLSDF